MLNLKTQNILIVKIKKLKIKKCKKINFHVITVFLHVFPIILSQPSYLCLDVDIFLNHILLTS